MEKLKTVLKASLLIGVLLVTFLSVAPPASADIDIIVVCPFGPATCAEGTLGGIPTTWQVGGIIIVVE